MSYFYWPCSVYHFFIIFPPLFFLKDPVLLWRIHWTSWYLGSSFAETERMKRRMLGRKLFHLQVWCLIYFLVFFNIWDSELYPRTWVDIYFRFDLISISLSIPLFFSSLSLSLSHSFFLISFTLFRPLPCPRLIISCSMLPYSSFILTYTFLLLSIEQEFVKQPFDLIKKSLTQYADVATFFGYTVFFTAALPAAPFFAWINTYLGKWL